MKLVILDRDGTINVDSDEFIKSPDEWQPLPGALEAIARLNHAGWHVAVASNQSGLGRGLFDVASLNAIHAKMHKAVAALGGRIDAVFYCPHSPDEGCQCRKPLPGLFEQIGERFGVDLKTTPVVGDTLRDLQAGALVGCMIAIAVGIKLSQIYSMPRLPLFYLVGGVFAMWVIGMLAVWIPAQRAASISPATATRTV